VDDECSNPLREKRKSTKREEEGKFCRNKKGKKKKEKESIQEDKGKNQKNKKGKMGGKDHTKCEGGSIDQKEKGGPMHGGMDKDVILAKETEKKRKPGGETKIRGNWGGFTGGGGKMVKRVHPLGEKNYGGRV